MTRALISVAADRRTPAPGERLVLATRLALGLAAIAGETVADVARTSVPWPLPHARPPRQRLPGVAVAAAARLSRSMTPVTSRARERLDPWYRRGLDEQRLNRALADAFGRALLGRIAAAVVREVDLDAVTDRIDLDRLVERIDVDAIVASVDFDRVVRQVLDQVDVDEIMRETTSGLADETVDALRVQGMHADRLVSQAVDRLLRRKGQRQTGLDP